MIYNIWVNYIFQILKIYFPFVTEVSIFDKGINHKFTFQYRVDYYATPNYGINYTNLGN